ncbi:geranylgeranyl transferase type-1 subunit beta [Tilletia horrida]|nr:geranylgeranyl transferase type-1 subunit beta [Tilletia horrida]
MTAVFEHKKHVAFWLRCLRMLPEPYTSGDTQRMTLGYFCLGALDLLGVAQSKIASDERAGLVEWVYAQQIPQAQGGGFRGSSSAGSSRLSESIHITMCYNALQNLAILRDDLSRVDRASLVRFVASCQHSDGSFSPAPGQSERDARFVYCAFALCDMLGGWNAIDQEAAVRFLLQSRNYDGGFGQGPGQESQGGSTYCALASLALASRLDNLSDRERTVDWLLSRQQSGSGFNGRPEKATDTCYSFWCGASLAILGEHDRIDPEADVRWLLSAQTRMGGISKVPGDMPDVMHSYLSHAALAMHGPSAAAGVGLEEGQLARLEPRWNLSDESARWLREHLR